MNQTRVEFATSEKTFVLQNIACLVTMAGNEADADLERNLGIQTNVDLVIENGVVAACGSQAGKSFEAKAQVIDARRWVVMPGLIDAHVHPLFAGSRAKETVMKANGLGYEEIAARGGGISVTTQATRQSPDEMLRSLFLKRARAALSRGVVLMDAKTGYGLNPVEEERHLRLILEACESTGERPHIAAAMLGPHAASPDVAGLDAYISNLIEALPRYTEMGTTALGKGIIVGMSADIFIERNYFSKEHGDRWLGAALQHGLDVHIHADEFSRSGGCELAAELAAKIEQTATSRRRSGRVLSVDHCQYATEGDLSRLAARGVVATALPATSFMSNIPYVDAKKWRESGIRVAIASDFNPGSCPVNDIWFSAYLALTRCGFSLSEVMRGVTVNAAHALGAEERFGRLALGRPAHLVAFEGNCPDDFFASPIGDHLELVVRA